MGSKTVSLREETYDRLERAKGDDESFSDVIDRLLRTDDQPLGGIVGILSDEEAARLREHSRAFRAEADERLARDR
jgi:predicted CopG family antitoxin